MESRIVSSFGNRFFYEKIAMFSFVILVPLFSFLFVFLNVSTGNIDYSILVIIAVFFGILIPVSGIYEYMIREEIILDGLSIKRKKGFIEETIELENIDQVFSSDLGGKIGVIVKGKNKASIGFGHGFNEDEKEQLLVQLIMLRKRYGFQTNLNLSEEEIYKELRKRGIDKHEARF
jgi:hypothetical protein